MKGTLLNLKTPTQKTQNKWHTNNKKTSPTPCGEELEEDDL